MQDNLSEDDISVKFITPAIVKVGWDEATQIRRQVSFTKGRIIVRGKLVSRGKAKKADFVLYWQHIPIALIVAKKSKFPAAHGMQQALDCAASLQVPVVYSSNGKSFVFHDKTGLIAQGCRRGSPTASAAASKSRNRDGALNDVPGSLWQASNDQE